MRIVFRALNGLLLGLPVALVAHTLVFRGHAAGASVHDVIVGAACLAAFTAILLRARRFLAHRAPHLSVEDAFPNLFTCTAAGAFWFSTFELCEQQHVVPFFAIAGAIVMVAVLARAAVDVCAHFAASLAIAVTLCAFVRRIRTGLRVTLAFTTPPIRSGFAYRLKLFSRPPPVFS